MLQLTQLSGYKVLFMVELLVAEAIFCHKLRRRPWFWLRLAACTAGCLAVSVLYPLGPYTVVSNSVLFFTLFFVTLIGCKVCFDESWWNILFCGVAAYSVQHIAFVVYNMIVTGLDLTGLLARMGTALNPYGEATVQQGLNPLTILAYADCYFLVYWYFGYFLNRRMTRNEDLSLGRKPLIAFSGLGIAVNIVLHMVTVLHTGDPGAAALENFYNLLCCVLILFLQFGVLSRRQLEQDKDRLQQMLAQKEEQYRHQQIYGNLSNALFLHKHNPPISRKGLPVPSQAGPFICYDAFAVKSSPLTQSITSFSAPATSFREIERPSEITVAPGCNVEMV